MTARPDLTILPGGGASALRFRGLGRVADLDLELGGPDRPRAVTAVLAACAEPARTEESIWSLTLAARIGGLLAIWSEGAGAGVLELRLRCPAQGCGADLEAGLPVAALMDLAREAEAAPVLEAPREAPHEALHEAGEGPRLRRPTGADQRLWRQRPQGDPEAAILATLALGGPVPGNAEGRAALAGRMAEFDPLPCFAVAIRCPDCGHEAAVAVDLEAELLARLARVQDRLFAEVDVLARRYGWSDAAILAMPAARRARYLRLSEAAEGWT